MKINLQHPRHLAIIAISIALVLLLTRPIIPTMRGYIHLGDIAIYFAAFTFGPVVGLIAGGVGTSLADLLTGSYAIFAPLSLVVHGIQGWVSGWIYQKYPTVSGSIFALLTGGIIVVGGYFIGQLVPIWGGPVAALASVPFNILQVLVGSLGGVVHFAAVRAYPRLRFA
jgi:uncharacterized membrane protein